MTSILGITYTDMLQMHHVEHNNLKFLSGVEVRSVRLMLQLSIDVPH